MVCHLRESISSPPLTVHSVINHDSMQREIQNQKYHLISGFTKFYVSVKCDCEMELGNLD